MDGLPPVDVAKLKTELLAELAKCLAKPIEDSVHLYM